MTFQQKKNAGYFCIWQYEVYWIAFFEISAICKYKKLRFISPLKQDAS